MNSKDLERKDRDDPLAHLRKHFMLPEDIVYLDGNSLGPLPRRVPGRMETVLTKEWGEDLISSWNRHYWIDLPSRIGDRIGGLIGAAAGQVVCSDSISVNLFKLLSAALSLRPGRSVILSQSDNFPTDLYMAEGLGGLLGRERCELRSVPGDELENALGEDIAVLMLTQVNFRDGRLHDIASMTSKAHEYGTLVLWDLAHSAGVVPLELDAWNVDMAVGCGYKFLNGGPGAPAFLYLAHHLQERAVQPLSGWMGHRAPFDFSPRYAPGEGVLRFLAGTPGVLGMAALDAALDVYDHTTIEALRKKSLSLTGSFIEAVETAGLPGIRVITPADDASRGSHVSLVHEKAFGISQALIANDVIVDYRTPDIVRFGFSPLYNRFRDISTAVDMLARIVHERMYLEPRFNQRKKVT